MTPQLYSIEHAPPSLPIWRTLLDDLANPPARRVARVLGISRRTVYRYNRTGRAPRVACLALFWLTRWGRSAVHAQAASDALMACSLVAGLERRIAELSAQLGHLQRLGGYGSANQPLADGLGYGGGLSPHGQPRLSDPPPVDLVPSPLAGSPVRSRQLAEARPGSLSPAPNTSAPPTPAGKRVHGPAADAAGAVAGRGARVRTGVAGPGPEGPPA